jgi:hypothetical protein
LLGVKLWKLLNRHHVDEKIVTDLAVSVDALTVSLGNPFGKNSWVFAVEQKIDSSQLAILILVLIVPVARVNLTGGVIVLN